jgi:hypothetical protein
MSEAFANVVSALISERKYQDDKWGDNLDKSNTIADYIGYMRNYLDQIDPTTPDAEQLAGIRKVTAIGVKAMEVYGAPQREGHEVKLSYSKVESHEVPAGTLDALLDDGCPHCGEDDCPFANISESEFEGAEPLTDEELDALVQNGQPVTEIERDVWYRVKETQRVYHYDEEDGGETKHRFLDIRAFAVTASGGHRLIDAYGTWYYVQSGWTVLSVPDAEVV